MTAVRGELTPEDPGEAGGLSEITGGYSRLVKSVDYLI